MHWRTSAENAIRNLRAYFAVTNIEDEQRIKVVFRMASRAEEVYDWQGLIGSKLSEVERLLGEGKALIDIATNLETPIDELEKFCKRCPLLRARAAELNTDLPMYKAVIATPTVKEARRKAYEELKKMPMLTGNLWAIRMILGVGEKQFRELCEYARKHGKELTGQGANSPASQTKHEVNRILCEAFQEATSKTVLATFEPTQGNGDATRLYANYGLVVSVERLRDAYDKAFDAHKHHAGNLMDKLEEGWPLEELLKQWKRDSNLRVLMPSGPSRAEDVIPKISDAHWRFDLIDADPYEGIQDLVGLVLPLLSDVSLLFTSANPSPKFGRRAKLAQFYRQQDTPEFGERLWAYDCWWHMWKAAELGFELVPIAVHKGWRASAQAGIDRIYFVAMRKTQPQLAVQEYLDHAANVLREEMTSPISQYLEGTVPLVRFGEDVDADNPVGLLGEGIISYRLSEVIAQYSRLQ